MEFRCPACDTSYRVPVRIDQQVRCARCNHVWRISESDFVFAEPEPEQDEAYVPEAFSAPGTHDEYDETAPEDEPEEDRLAALLERGEAWPGENDRTDEMFGDEPQEAPAQRQQPAAVEQRHDHPAQAGDETARDADASPDTLGEHTAGDTPAGLTEEPGSSGPLGHEFPDRWFSERLGEASAAEPEAETGNNDAGFERIMEGIEDVIAEGGADIDDLARHKTEPQSAEPLSAFTEDAQRSGFRSGDDAPAHTAAPDDDGDPDPWNGKVVQFTGRGADLRPDSGSAQQERLGGEPEDTSRGDESVETMATFMNKIAGPPAQSADSSDQVVPSGFAGASVRQTPELGDAGKTDQDHFEALQDGMEAAVHREDAGAFEEADDAEAWREQDYHDEDEAHAAAQRESLSFDPQQEAFYEPENAPDTGADSFAAQHREFEQRDEIAEDRYNDRTVPAASEPQQPDRRSPSAAAGAMQPDDDEELLAEYDFGDGEQPEPSPVSRAAARSGFGTLTVAAAWALFVIVFGAAVVTTLSFRNQIADVLPASESVFEAVGFPLDKPALSFEDVRYSWQGTPPEVLILEGEVTNLSGEVVEIPRLQISVRDENGAELLEDSRFLGQAALAPGETMQFSIDLKAPADKLKTVELNF